jgi:hypothetical protein
LLLQLLAAELLAIGGRWSLLLKLSKALMMLLLCMVVEQTVDVVGASDASSVVNDAAAGGGERERDEAGHHRPKVLGGSEKEGDKALTINLPQLFANTFKLKF